MKVKLRIVEIFMTMMLLPSALLSQDSFGIISTSIQSNDTVYTNAGLVVTFSDPISIESLQAEKTEYVEYFLFGQNIVDSLRVFIRNSSNVTLNGQPLSFWYDQSSHSFAFLHESTPHYPDGTGTGFILDSVNTFHLHDVTSESGDSLSSDLTIQFIRDDELFYNVAPNPYYGTTIWDPHPPDSSNWDPKVLFMHLPAACTISLRTHDGLFLKSIEHNQAGNDGFEYLSLKDDYGQVFPSGIYRWSIDSEDYPTFHHGALFVLLPSITSTGINGRNEERPDDFSITAIFPNPFNPSTTIAYELPERSDVSLIVYDILGRNIWSHEEFSKPVGYYSLQWNGLDNDGIQVSSGVYLISFTTHTSAEASACRPEFRAVQKAVLIR